MKTFYLDRKIDKSGVSGTGKVAEGVVFSNGRVVLCWLSVRPSVEVLDSVDDLYAIHGHEGNTEIVFTG